MGERPNRAERTTARALRQASSRDRADRHRALDEDVHVVTSGWSRAGYSDATCERLVQPEGVDVVEAP